MCDFITFQKNDGGKLPVLRDRATAEGSQMEHQ